MLRQEINIASSKKFYFSVVNIALILSLPNSTREAMDSRSCQVHTFQDKI